MTEERRHQSLTSKLKVWSLELGILVSVCVIGGMLIKASAQLAKLKSNADLVPATILTVTDLDKRVALLEDGKKEFSLMVNRRFDRLERLIDRGR